MQHSPYWDHDDLVLHGKAVGSQRSLREVAGFKFADHGGSGSPTGSPQRRGVGSRGPRPSEVRRAREKYAAAAGQPLSSSKGRDTAAQRGSVPRRGTSPARPSSATLEAADEAYVAFERRNKYGSAAGQPFPSSKGRDTAAQRGSSVPRGTSPARPSSAARARRGVSPGAKLGVSPAQGPPVTKAAGGPQLRKDGSQARGSPDLRLRGRNATEAKEPAPKPRPSSGGARRPAQKADRASAMWHYRRTNPNASFIQAA